MASIFVSYSRQDRKRVSPLVELLEAQGWTVWWDREINPGDSFEELIDQQITQASVVVVVWSKHSVNSRWVRNEALEAMERDILVPVNLDNSKLPVAFRQTQAADFKHWPNHVDDDEVNLLLGAVASKLSDESSPTKFHSPAAVSSAKILWGFAGLFVVMLAIGAIAWRSYEQPADTASGADSLAIMRLQTGNKSPAEIFFADSLADEVAGSLSAIEGVQVSSRLASWEIPAGLARQDVGRRLNVNYLLEGQVNERGQEMAVEVVLIETSTGEVLFGETYMSASKDLQTLRTEVTDAVLKAMRPGASSSDITRVPAQTYDSGAYVLYLRAKDLLRTSGEQEVLSDARDLLIQATQRDPSLGAAFAGLCRANLGLYADTSSAQSFEDAERACHRALTLNERSAEVHLALGKLNETSGQYDRARSEYEQALRIDPLLADGLSGIGYSWAKSGDNLKAEQAFLGSIDIQPGYWRSHNALGWFYMQQGRNYEAIEAYSQVTYLAPTNAWGFSNLGAARFGVGDFQGAIREWRRAIEIEPDRSALSNMGTAFYYLRDFSAAADMYSQALVRAPDDYRLWINLGDALRFVDVQSTKLDIELETVTDAQSAYRRAIDFAAKEQVINPTKVTTLSAQATAFAFLQEPAQALAMLQRALQLDDRDIDVLYYATITHLNLGQPDVALDFLEQAVTNGYPRVFVSHDALFDPLRDLPRFLQLTEALEN